MLDILCIILIDSWLIILKYPKFLIILFGNLERPLSFENVSPLKNKLSKLVCDTSCSNLSSCSNANKDIVFELRKSKRSKKDTDFGSEFCYFLLEDDPKTYGKAMRSIVAPFWERSY